MTIYVSHSRNFDFENELYVPLGNSSLAEDHRFIFPHENGNAEGFDAKELFSGKKCDLVLAEVSYPATGQGIELGWADALGIRVICVFKKGCKISNSLQRITNDFIEYSDSSDMIKKLQELIHEQS